MPRVREACCQSLDFLRCSRRRCVADGSTRATASPVYTPLVALVPGLAMSLAVLLVPPEPLDRAGHDTA